MAPLITSILPFLILSIQVGVSGTSVDSSNTQSPSEEFYSRGCQLLNNAPPINVAADLYQSPLNLQDKGESEYSWAAERAINNFTSTLGFSDSVLVQKTEDVFLAASTGQDTTLSDAPGGPPPPPRSQAGKTIRPGKSGSICLAAAFNTRYGSPVTVEPCNPNIYSGQSWTYSGGSLSMQGLYGLMCLGEFFAPLSLSFLGF
jgi:hypothetical protein